MKASHLGSWDFPYIFWTQLTSPEESCVSKTRHIPYTPYQLFSTQPVKNMVDLSCSTMSDYQELHILANIQHMLSMSFVRLKFMVRPSLSKTSRGWNLNWRLSKSLKSNKYAMNGNLWQCLKKITHIHICDLWDYNT